MNLIEKKVFRNIIKNKIINKNTKVGLALSGGKDSTLALYFLIRFFNRYNKDINNLYVIHINNNLKYYSNLEEKYIRKIINYFNNIFNIDLNLVESSFIEDHGFSLDELIKKLNQHPCQICGVLRRYSINKLAKKTKVDILITGHNLDDEVETFIMNILRGNISLIARQGMLSGIKHQYGFIQRVKILYNIKEDEIREFINNKKIPYLKKQCKYKHNSFRKQISDFLDKIDKKHKNTKYATLKTLEYFNKLIRYDYYKDNEKINYCKICSEPSSKEICNRCSILNEINKD